MADSLLYFFSNSTSYVLLWKIILRAEFTNLRSGKIVFYQGSISFLPKDLERGRKKSPGIKLTQINGFDFSDDGN